MSDAEIDTARCQSAKVQAKAWARSGNQVLIWNIDISGCLSNVGPTVR